MIELSQSSAQKELSHKKRRSISPSQDGSEFLLKLKKHDRNQAEIKLFCPKVSELNNNHVVLDISLTIPRSLGSLDK